MADGAFSLPVQQRGSGYELQQNAGSSPFARPPIQPMSSLDERLLPDLVQTDVPWAVLSQQATLVFAGAALPGRMRPAICSGEQSRQSCSSIQATWSGRLMSGHGAASSSCSGPTAGFGAVAAQLQAKACMVSAWIRGTVSATRSMADNHSITMHSSGVRWLWDMSAPFWLLAA